jgi:hypothetical protein
MDIIRSALRRAARCGVRMILVAALSGPCPVLGADGPIGGAPLTGQPVEDGWALRGAPLRGEPSWDPALDGRPLGGEPVEEWRPLEGDPLGSDPVEESQPIQGAPLH